MTTPVWVAGVDGCPSGWIAVLFPVDTPSKAIVRFCSDFQAVLDLVEVPCVIAIDMPIGLPERTGPKGRAPERHVRPLLGQRQSSVFSVPPRAAVMQTDYREACETALQLSDPPRKIAKQTFHLFPKIREIDALMTPELEQRVYECHPEVAFWALNQETPVPLPKKIKSRPNLQGLALRTDLLEREGIPAERLADRSTAFRKVGRDDIIDACVCAWTARRIVRKEAVCYPADAPRDAKGLRMAIWA